MLEWYVPHRYYIVKVYHETLYPSQKYVHKSYLDLRLARMDVNGPRYEPKPQKLTTILVATTVLRCLTMLLDVPVVMYLYLVSDNYL